MKKNLYKFTIEQLNEKNKDEIDKQKLIFEATSHEDIFKIVEQMKAKTSFSDEDTKAFFVGLKLFSSVMLKNMNDELFKEFLPHFKTFMKELKKKGRD